VTFECRNIRKINDLKIPTSVCKQNERIGLIIWSLKSFNILNEYFFNKEVGINFDKNFLNIFFENIFVLFT